MNERTEPFSMPASLNLLWLQSAGCGGCTMSLLCSGARDLTAALDAVGVRVLWHPSLSEESGDEAKRILEQCASGEIPLDVLCVEGALLRGPRGTGRFHRHAGSERPMMDWVKEIAQAARLPWIKLAAGWRDREWQDGLRPGRGWSGLAAAPESGVCVEVAQDVHGQPAFDALQYSALCAS